MKKLDLDAHTCIKLLKNAVILCVWVQLRKARKNIMLKLSDNPAIIFPDDCLNGDENTGLWWVAHTKARNEKALAWQLLKMEITYFLPLVEKTSIKGKRKFKSLLPLFGGYLFFCGDDEDRYKALTTNRIANVIPVADQESFVSQLRDVYTALTCGAEVDPFPSVVEGKRCVVTSGPLRGVEGIVEKKESVTRILLKVDILGQSAAVTIDPAFLEPVS